MKDEKKKQREKRLQHLQKLVMEIRGLLNAVEPMVADIIEEERSRT